ncbi:MAG: DUF167 family protein [Rhodospirillales bacterium]|nr:DUF167 family protein [Rhodospirillales bacterium]MDH3914389.1 DUF167 family protein [Rhodospirillales bacterium]MDH3969987.1 DUF167 family protein [Rhodospirillales bacterium]
MAGTNQSPFSSSTTGLRVALRLQPGARRAGVEGLGELADGTVVLKVRVTEPPEGGKANTALVKLLAKTWKLPKTTIGIVAGHGQRQKTLLISGDPAVLETRLESWLAGVGGGRR